MPVEEEQVVNHRFTRTIFAHWPAGHGPRHHGEDFLPIEDCEKIRRRIEEQIATGQLFSLMINASWRARTDEWWEKYSVQSPKFNISPATVGGREYNYANVLRAIKEHYAKEMMERLTRGFQGALGGAHGGAGANRTPRQAKRSAGEQHAPCLEWGDACGASEHHREQEGYAEHPEPRHAVLPGVRPGLEDVPRRGRPRSASPRRAVEQLLVARAPFGRR